MRVLHVVPSYLPAWRYGGPVRSVHGLCKALARRGHDVHVFTTDVDGPGRSDVPVGTPVDVDGVKVWYFGSPLLRRLYWAPAMKRALRHDVPAFDLLHLHSIYLWPTSAAARIARHRRVPYLLAPRGMLAGTLIRGKSRLLKSAWIALFERRNLRAAAAVHFTSAAEAEAAKALGFDRGATCIVPNGLEDEDFLVPGHRTDTGGGWGSVRPYLLFVGRISPEKGLARLIEAVARVPEVTLLVAGNDESGHESALRATAARLGVEHRVRFVGPVREDDKRALMAHADALVLPSAFESFGNVVVEAMAVGCPVLVTQGVGAADLVRHSGAGIVVDTAAASLAAGIETLLSDAARRETMREAGPAYARAHLTWDAIAIRMESAYRSALSMGR